MPLVCSHASQAILPDESRCAQVGRHVRCHSSTLASKVMCVSHFELICQLSATAGGPVICRNSEVGQEVKGWRWLKSKVKLYFTVISMNVSLSGRESTGETERGKKMERGKKRENTFRISVIHCLSVCLPLCHLVSNLDIVSIYIRMPFCM